MKGKLLVCVSKSAVMSVMAAVCVGCCFAQTTATGASEPELPVVRIGLSVWSEPSNNEPIIRETLKMFENTFGKDRISVKMYGLEELEKAIRSNQLDIFQSSAGFYRRQLEYGVRAIATAASDRFPDPNSSEGSTIIVRKDRKDIQKLADAKGMVLAANSPNGFTGYQVALGEVARIGEDPNKFFSRTIFTGTGRGVHGVIESVLSGDADVGFLRLCFLEHFPKEAAQLRVLNAREVGVDGCACSTERYPTWTISATSRATPEISRAVAAALLTMPVTENGYYWGIANDYTSVDNLFKTLKIGPYEYLAHWTLQRFLSEYWPFLAFALIAVAGLIYHGVAIERINRFQAIRLKEALRRQKVLERKSQMASSHIDELQRIGTVGLLSSMVAHELNQPLSAILLHARSLQRFAEKGMVQKMNEVCGDISAQATRAFNIVEKVRGYAKGNTQRQRVDLSKLVEKTAHDFELSRRSHGHIATHVQSGVFATVDAMEMEIVILNLLKNASNALRERSDGSIEVRLFTKENSVFLEIADNGEFFSKRDIELISQPIVSSQHAGLGLGLAIVRTIVEKHGGRIAFDANAERGLCVTITLPADKEEKDDSEV